MIAIVDDQGRLRSVGTRVASKLPPGWRAVPLPTGVDPESHEWDDTARGWVPRPPKVVVDRAEDLRARVQARFPQLPGLVVDGVVEEMARVLGPFRYRSQAEPPDLEARDE